MTNPACVDIVLGTLRCCKGVLEVRLLSADERRRIFVVEEEAEEKIAYGMCRTFNKGVRVALAMEHTAALVIDSSIFEYPHHPHMRMLHGDTVVGEQIRNEERIRELKKDRSNFFLWENFVLYMLRLPKGAEERKRLRMVYEERSAAQLEDHPCVERSAFGTPSMEGDLLVKELLCAANENPNMGTCVVGFDLRKE